MSNISTEIANFILKKPGYLKEGSRRIAKRFDCSREEAKEGIKQAREAIKSDVNYIDARENKYNPEPIETKTNGLNVKSMWQAPDGTWLYSYKNNGESLDEGKVRSIVQDSIKDVKPYKLLSKGDSNNRGLFVWSSDKHVGASVDSSIYDNEYDKDEFDRRMSKVVKKCFKLKEIFGKFDHLCLADLGDPLDGMDNTTVRGGHELDQNMSNEEQAKAYIEVQKRVIDTLVEGDIADSYTVWNVCNDNHSGSFGYVANLAISEYIKVRYPDIRVYNQTKFIDHTSYGVHDIMLSHGKDTTDRQKGLPLNLDDRTEKFISEYIDYHGLNGTRHFIKGDLHRSAENITNKFRYKNCPSIFGASKWIHSNFGMGKPSCDIEIFDKDSSEVIKTSIDLG